MRHLAKLAATGIAAALLATACGATNVLLGKTPDQIVQLASSRVTGESYRMTMGETTTVDASGVEGMPSSMLDAMTSAMSGITISGRGEVQSAQRMTMNMTTSAAGKTVKMQAVMYDGHFYIALNGDNRFADAGTLNFQGAAATPDDIKQLLTNATAVKDLGPTVHDGQRVDHLSAMLGSDYISSVLNKVTGSGSGADAIKAIAGLLKDVFTIRDATLDVYVRDVDGRVEAVSSHMTMAMDMGKFVAKLIGQYGGRPGAGSGLGNVTGALVMKITGTNNFSDYGAKITVTKPTVDPNAPSLPNIFGGSGGA